MQAPSRATLLQTNNMPCLWRRWHTPTVLPVIGAGKLVAKVADHLEGLRVPAPEGVHGHGDEDDPLRPAYLLIGVELPGHSLLHHLLPLLETLMSSQHIYEPGTILSFFFIFIFLALLSYIFMSSVILYFCRLQGFKFCQFFSALLAFILKERKGRCQGQRCQSCSKMAQEEKGV